ncbi:hypothetical protein KXD40_005955 [Peronospora effusa]|nr:hypothetical protein KXD40_005955 [Peronospora effusa]
MAADTKYLYVHILCCVCASVLTLAYEGRGVDEGIQPKLSLAKLHELKLCLLNYSISWFSTMIRRSQIFRRPHYYPFRRIRAVRLLLYSNRRGLAVSSIQQGRKLSLDFKIEMQSVQESIWQIRS